MALTLILALLALVAWAILVFVVALPSGMIHVLLAVGVTLLIRWWAYDHDPVA